MILDACEWGAFLPASVRTSSPADTVVLLEEALEYTSAKAGLAQEASPQFHAGSVGAWAPGGEPDVHAGLYEAFSTGQEPAQIRGCPRGGSMPALPSLRQQPHRFPEAAPPPGTTSSPTECTEGNLVGPGAQRAMSGAHPPCYVPPPGAHQQQAPTHSHAVISSSGPAHAVQALRGGPLGVGLGRCGSQGDLSTAQHGMHTHAAAAANMPRGGSSLSLMSLGTSAATVAGRSLAPHLHSSLPKLSCLCPSMAAATHGLNRSDSTATAASGVAAYTRMAMASQAQAGFQAHDCLRPPHSHLPQPTSPTDRYAFGSYPPAMAMPPPALHGSLASLPADDNSCRLGRASVQSPATSSDQSSADTLLIDNRGVLAAAAGAPPFPPPSHADVPLSGTTRFVPSPAPMFPPAPDMQQRAAFAAVPGSPLTHSALARSDSPLRDRVGSVSSPLHQLPSLPVPAMPAVGDGVVIMSHGMCTTGARPAAVAPTGSGGPTMIGGGAATTPGVHALALALAAAPQPSSHTAPALRPPTPVPAGKPYAATAAGSTSAAAAGLGPANSGVRKAVTSGTAAGSGHKKRSRQDIAAMALRPDGQPPARKTSKRMSCWNCGAHNTPQWRCGPDGPRTLCNACGVRYKKGLPLAYWEAKLKAGLVPDNHPARLASPHAAVAPSASADGSTTPAATAIGALAAALDT